MTNFRFILENGSKKHHCPNCNKKRFVRYLDIETGEILPTEYGRCDREAKCGYHLNPYNDGYAKNIWLLENGKQSNWKPAQLPKYTPTPKPIKPTVFFPFEIFKQTLTGYEKNVFIQNLLSNVSFPFDVADVEKIISLYRLGTVQNGYRSGAITFPFIDVDQNIRTIQVKQFDQTNHTTGTDFLHSMIEKHHTRKNKPLPRWLTAYNNNEIKVSCLFGEHLLSKYPDNPIALVEAPKTAIYGTLYFGFPDDSKNLLWLSVYNLSSLNLEKVKSLRGRRVILFPDLSTTGHAYKSWSEKAKSFQKILPNTTFKVSDLLERLAPRTDKEKGKDIADYLIKLDWKQFRVQPDIERPLPELTPPTEPDPKPLPIETAEKKTFSFKDLAIQIIGTFSNEPKPDILLRIQEITGVDYAGAKEFFDKMVNEKIISFAIDDRYYLTGSLPY